jgi:pimeloyl-ACP methyl ester carboxylesterase
MPGLMVDGVQLAYEERGAGEPLVLIHGTGFQIELWRSSRDDLSARHRVSLTTGGATGARSIARCATIADTWRTRSR